MPARSLSPLEALPAEIYLPIIASLSSKDLYALCNASRHLLQATRSTLAKKKVRVVLTWDNIRLWRRRFRLSDDPLSIPIRSIEIDFASCIFHQSTPARMVDRMAVDARHPLLPLPSSLRSLSFGHNSFNRHPDLYLYILSTLARDAPRLEHLQIAWADPSSSAPPLPLSLGSMSHLKSISSTFYAPAANMAFDLLSLPPSITTLVLHKSYHIHPSTIGSILARLPLLEDLSFTGLTSEASLATWAAIADHSPPHLRRTYATMMPDFFAASSQGDVPAFTEHLDRLASLSPPIPLEVFSVSNLKYVSLPVHIGLIHAAFSSSLRVMVLGDLRNITLPTNLTWPHLRRLEISSAKSFILLPATGDGPSITFPALHHLTLAQVESYTRCDPISSPLFPALKTLALTNIPGEMCDLFPPTLPLDELILGNFPSQHLLTVMRRFLPMSIGTLTCFWSVSRAQREVMHTILQETGQGNITHVNIPPS